MPSVMVESESPANVLPFVDYLVLGDDPHLIARACLSCRATYFDRRNACAACGSAAGFETVKIDRDGILTSFTIVSMAAPGISVPFVAGIIDCGGTKVRANIVNVEPTAEHVSLGMRVRLATVPYGVDSAGRKAVGFAFEPVREEVR